MAKSAGPRELVDLGNPAGSMSTSFAIPKSDTADLPVCTRVIYLACEGTLHYTMIDGSERTRVLAAGYHPLRIKRVWDSGTTFTQEQMEGHY